MRARGYGSTKKRTSFVEYKFGTRNIILSIVLGILLFVVIFCAVNNGTYAEYIPELKLVWFGDWYMFIGTIAYTIFLLLPALIDIKEIIKWQILRSKI